MPPPVAPTVGHEYRPHLIYRLELHEISDGQPLFTSFGQINLADSAKKRPCGRYHRAVCYFSENTADLVDFHRTGKGMTTSP
jgi:hypothetical protein